MCIRDRVGTGYVGLVTGTCLAEIDAGNIICVDIDDIKINNLKKGISPIYENRLEELINKNYKKGNLDFTTDYKLSLIHILNNFELKPWEARLYKIN